MRVIRVVTLVALTGVPLLGAGLWAQVAGQGYRAVGVAKAGDIAYPANSAVTGVVTLGVSVDASGAVQKVTAVRDLPPLTGAAQDGVKAWKFAAAMKEGQPAAGDVRVHLVFNPYNPGGTQIQGGEEPAPNYSAAGVDADFQPAQLLSAMYAQYPVNTTGNGTVVAVLNVDAQGNVGAVRVIRGAGPLAGAVTRTVKDWKFTPASYKGKPVASVIPVAYVFASPALGTP